MIAVTDSEFTKNFGHYIKVAQCEPLVVTSDEGGIGYFISAAEYEEYQQVKAQMPRAYSVDELSEETVQAIAKSKMATRHDYLNSLLDG